MPSTRQRTASTQSDRLDGFDPSASRAVHTGGIPKRTGGRKTNTYAAWDAEVAYLFENLGEATEYANVPKAQSVVAGMRRLHGLDAKSRGVDKETGVGTVWLTVPVLTDDDGNVTGQDDEKITEIKAKYAK